MEMDTGSSVTAGTLDIGLIHTSISISLCSFQSPVMPINPYPFLHYYSFSFALIIKRKYISKLQAPKINDAASALNTHICIFLRKVKFLCTQLSLVYCRWVYEGQTPHKALLGSGTQSEAVRISGARRHLTSRPAGQHPLPLKVMVTL